jgi:hypothetical protein
MGIARGEIFEIVSCVISGMVTFPKFTKISFLHAMQFPLHIVSSAILTNVEGALLPHLQCNQIGAYRYELELTLLRIPY